MEPLCLTEICIAILNVKKYQRKNLLRKLAQCRLLKICSISASSFRKKDFFLRFHSFSKGEFIKEIGSVPILKICSISTSSFNKKNLFHIFHSFLKAEFIKEIGPVPIVKIYSISTLSANKFYSTFSLIFKGRIY